MIKWCNSAIVTFRLETLDGSDSILESFDGIGMVYLNFVLLNQARALILWQNLLFIVHYFIIYF